MIELHDAQLAPHAKIHQELFASDAIEAGCALRKTSRMRPNLRERRRELGLTLEAMAERMKVSVSQVSRWESGANAIPSSRLGDLAEAYEMPVGAIHGERTVPTEPARWVPLIGVVQAGNFREAVESPRGEVIAPLAVGPRSFALTPEGDSMDLVLDSDEGYVVFDPDQTDLIDGKIYVVMNDVGEATIKEFRTNPARLVPKSSNPEHKEIVIGRDGFRVVARAVCKVAPE